MAATLKTIGPNPYIRAYAAHIPRIGGWALALGIFLGWPFAFSAANKRGIWTPNRD